MPGNNFSSVSDCVCVNLFDGCFRSIPDVPLASASAAVVAAEQHVRAPADAAAMLRSFQDAALVAAVGQLQGPLVGAPVPGLASQSGSVASASVGSPVASAPVIGNGFATVPTPAPGLVGLAQGQTQQAQQQLAHQQRTLGQAVVLAAQSAPLPSAAVNNVNNNNNNNNNAVLQMVPR